MAMSKWSASIREIKALDEMIRTMVLMVWSIWQFKPFFKPKGHNLLHLCEVWLTVGPPRILWCMKSKKLAIFVACHVLGGLL
jgi:hypothetical protein